MTYSEKKREYNKQYAKDNMKRIPLDVSNDMYSVWKSAADAAGMPLNTFIKDSVNHRISNAE